MDRIQSFAEDSAAILTQEHRAGRVSRRELLAGMAAMGLAATAPGFARAQARPEVVVANFGGEAVPAFREAFEVPYKAAGGRMVIDGSGPSNGKIKTMVQARNVAWDVADSGVAGTGELGPLGLLEEIDYSIVDRNKVDPEFAYKYGVANYMFSIVMAWDSKKIPGKPTLADFFDIKKYPGRRMLRRNNQAMLELALLADGVPADKLYPLDLDRAFKKLATIKEHCLYWNSGAESQSLLRDGECVMGLLWNTRANLLKRETNGQIDYTFNQALLQPGLWVVPKGNPAGKEAMRAIAAMQAPEGQVKLLASMGNGPANPAASALVPDALKPINPSDPANVAVQAKIDAGWYEKHGAAAMQRFLDSISA
ncbi:ABC transporter substrate-binding protein [Roseomonas marmotae]|uniref:ABC transporter substrate-binding protein n=1 Tax=Roseomonas marmotae TaxID=2768161 RepID=A0ABS3KKD0_9PROT|nr:ABC transporter substrate-binding protein [Roseomonas marmotae]MBO1076791.1 ABC transporter substrate-binding protein [Roseomonas marmotae]QTI78744.1 ABC transporter substrate-binding protein [Roseomonas marmotae]